MNQVKIRGALCGLLAGMLIPAAFAVDVPFAPNATVSPAGGSTSAVAADFDGDGDPDILATWFADNKVAWYENTDGAGTFGPERVISTTATGAIWAIAADFDGDGDPDVAVSVSNVSRIWWFENTDGAGTFGPEHVVATGVFTLQKIHADDLDGDGDLDLLSASENQDKIAWYENRLGEPSADFGPQQNITLAADGATAVFTADLDRDGDADVLSASRIDDRIAWYENRLDEPSADFGPQQTLSTNADQAWAVTAADLDRDGDLDVVSGSFTDNKVAWYENRLDEPSADFGPEQIVSTTAMGAIDVTPVDLDRDGDIDLAVAPFNGGQVEWYENLDGSGTFGPSRTVAGFRFSVRIVSVADVDNDGDPDLISPEAGLNALAWHENLTIHRNASFPEREVIASTVDGAYWVDAADLDNDGDLDALSAAVNDHQISWYENTDGAGTFGPEQVIVGSEFLARFVSASDLDRDGDADVLSAGQSTNDVAWYENRLNEPSADFGPKQEISDTFDGQSAWSAVGTDLDRDGDPDVLATFLTSDTVVWYENRLDEPSADFGPLQLISGLPNRPVLATGADLDRDGDLDVLLAAAGINGKIAWYENRLDEPSVDFGPERTITTAVDLARIALAADVDGDGDLDVVTSSADDNKVAWHENRLDEPSADFGPQQIVDILPDSGIALSVHPGDVDNDGDVDLLAATQSAGEIYWYENLDGLGGFSSRRLVSDAPLGPYGLKLADLDRDGDLDLLSASEFDDAVAWYPNRGGQFALSTNATAPSDICEGETEDLLRVHATHNGRAGDTDLELVTLLLLLEAAPGLPLTTAQGNALIERLWVYLDDGSGTFDAGSDTLVTTVQELSLAGGLQTVTFIDGSPLVQVVLGTPREYFVVAELTTIAALQPQGGFCVTHVTEGGGSADDRDNDIPLVAELVANTTVCLSIPDADGDGVCDADDNCPVDFNPGQENADGDPDGNACDPDDDDDGILDDGDGSGTDGDAPCTGGQTTGCDDNCPFDVNPDQSDGNQNGIGTACENICELVIGPQAGTDFPTIFAALPSAEDGCLLRVKPATYVAPLVLNKYVRMIAEDGSATTIIDIGGSSVAVDIPPRAIPGRVVIEGFTIRNATTAIDTDESLTLTDCNLEAFTGTGVRLGLGEHRLERVHVDAASGDGIVLDALAGAVLDRVRVENASGTALSVAGAAQVVTSVFVNGSETGIDVLATGSLTMSYSTVAGNADGMIGQSAAISVDHSIIWGSEIDVTGVPCSAFTYSDVGTDCTSQTGNIFANPLFVAAGSGDFHLPIGSPAVDAGEPPQQYTGLPCHDFDGNRRLLDADGDNVSHSDMGAYELDNSSALSPGDPANLRMPDATTLLWDAEPSSALYQVNRGDLSTLGYDYLVECRGTSASTSFGLTTELPAAGDGFFYLVSGKDGGGEEGTLGFGTCDERSKIFNPCP